MITYQLLNKYNEIAHFCTSRQGGVSVGNYASWNLSAFTGDIPESIAENSKILCDKLHINSNQLIIPFQTHGTEIRKIDEAFFQLNSTEKADYLNGVDALITALPRVCIGITTADCVPLLFFDPVLKIVAAAHAGWRGTCAGIAEKTVKSMVENYHSKASDILVVVGPSISVHVYEVGNDVVVNFEKEGFCVEEIIESHNDAIFLDLWKANQQSLEKAGILASNIEISGICTFTEHERFFSARRLGIKSGRILSGIMLKK